MLHRGKLSHQQFLKGSSSSWKDTLIDFTALFQMCDCFDFKIYLCVAQGAVQQACGHMYLDEGEELELGSSRDHLLAFSAYTTRAVNATSGQVINAYRRTWQSHVKVDRQGGPSPRGILKGQAKDFGLKGSSRVQPLGIGR